jgi:hypothetical protein
MTELKNIDAELREFRSRLWAAAAFVLCCFAFLAYRLTVLQIDVVTMTSPAVPRPTASPWCRWCPTGG